MNEHAKNQWSMVGFLTIFLFFKNHMYGSKPIVSIFEN
jgi:hypothetical protein